MKSRPLVLALAVLAPSAFAQVTTTTAIGAVTDALGGAIINAAVSIRDQDRGQIYTTTTNNEGEYRISQLPGGTLPDHHRFSWL